MNRHCYVEPCDAIRYSFATGAVAKWLRRRSAKPLFGGSTPPGTFLWKTSLREFSLAAGAFYRKRRFASFLRPRALFMENVASLAAGAFCRKRRFASFLWPRALFVENVASRVFFGRGRFLWKTSKTSLREFSLAAGALYRKRRFRDFSLAAGAFYRKKMRVNFL